MKSEWVQESIRKSLISLRRLFQRRELTSLWASAFRQSSDLDYFDLRLLDAVQVANDGEAGATVGEVAALLGVDPSRASKQVAAAVKKGLLTRVAAQDDARKVLLHITPRGAKIQAKGGELTRSRIELALQSWPAAERARLAELLSRFVGKLGP